MWVSAHIGIRGNKAADKLAKASLQQRSIGETKMTFEDGKLLEKKFFWALREDEWKDVGAENKLFQILPSALGYHDLTGLSRKEATVITRLKIGHANRTHGYLFEEFQNPELCECDELFDFELNTSSSVNWVKCLGKRAFEIKGRGILISNDISELKKII